MHRDMTPSRLDVVIRLATIAMSVAAVHLLLANDGELLWAHVSTIRTGGRHMVARRPVIEARKIARRVFAHRVLSELSELVALD